MFQYTFFNDHKDNRPKPRTGSSLLDLTGHKHLIVENKEDAPLFSVAVFDGKRAKANVESVCALVYDYDDLTEKQAEAVLTAAKEYTCVIGTSFSHGIKGTRFRAVFALSRPINSAEEYKAVWIEFDKRLSGGLADPQAKDASRISYVFSTSADRESQAFIQEHTGKVVDVDSLKAFYTPAKVKFVAETDADLPAPMAIGRFLRKLLEKSVAVEGKGGSLDAMSVAASAVSYGIPREYFPALVAKWNAKCQPQWSDEELLHKYDSVDMVVPSCAVGRGKRCNSSEAYAFLRGIPGVRTMKDPSGVLYLSLKDQAADMLNQGVTEILPLESKAMLQKMFGIIHKLDGFPPAQTCVKELLSVLQNEAASKSPTDIRTRNYATEDAIYIDLAQPGNNKCVEITAQSCQVLSEPPEGVVFARSPSMGALPEPDFECTEDLLRRLVKTMDDDQYRHFRGFLVSSCRGSAPYMSLAINGPAGSGKSLISEMAGGIIDPRQPQMMGSPREARDVATAARHRFLMVYNNIQFITAEMSDMFCVLLEGEGLQQRELYTTSDESVFKEARPLLMNGIPEFVNASDLASRTRCIRLNTIKEGQLGKEDIRKWFRQDLPGILGYLYQELSAGLRRAREIEREVDWGKLRMREVVSWVCAAEEHRGLPTGDYKELSTQQLEHDEIDLVANNSFANALMTFMEGRENPLEATALQLFNDLKEYQDPDQGPVWDKSDKTLPYSAKKVANDLRRLTPSLYAAGLKVERVSVGPKCRKGFRITNIAK